MGQNAVKLGTYGFIKGAYSFIASSTVREEFALESLGYQMEKIVLKATELGLGTCWLGGTVQPRLIRKSHGAWKR